ncbi:PLP-dependent transferase [Sistotremastrum niveocremeum HHB9708]|uniref:PLP-dependent transferase n=1 Tax=Sistotremastrum niveocremeum HHB9708 TaxID=1314777 RepID=A0A164P7B6_9AGAM|nr:PLP-dependent transferase [Sistotremastrum niveocremeum HHB9708]
MSGVRFLLSSTVKATAPPPIPLAYQWAASYVRTPERPLIDLSQGVPGISPPDTLLEAIGKTSSSPAACGYGPMNGEAPMRLALVNEMKSVYGEDADIKPQDVALTSGCNMAFIAAVMSVASAGDEVILPVPWYFNHQMSLTMLGIGVVPLYTHSTRGFRPNVSECASLITSKTRAIALVTPNNPTGAVYPPELIKAFAELAYSKNVALIVDETYRDLIVEGQPHDLFHSSLGDGTWRSTLIHLFSFSKSYCLPGHRLGAMVADSSVLQQTNTVLDCLQICPPRPIQLALHPLMPTLRPFVQSTSAAIASRHRLFHRVLPQSWSIKSQGGFFAFVRHPFPGTSSEIVSKILATRYGVVTLPGTFFAPTAGDKKTDWSDAEECVRFSVANVTDEQVIQLGLRLAEVEEELSTVLSSGCTE